MFSRIAVDGVIDKAAFVAWYTTERSKPALVGEANIAPIFKKAKTASDGASSTSSVPRLTAARRTALLKNFVTGLKKAMKAKKWYSMRACVHENAAYSSARHATPCNAMQHRTI